MERSDAGTVSPDQVRLAIQGDRAAVTAITQAYLPRVYGLCLRVSRSRQVAEEATQETFVRALRGLPRLRKPESLGSWILMIAANTAKELLSQTGTLPLVDHEPAVEDGNGASALEVQRSALEYAVTQLQGDERDLFLLHTVEGVALEDLARDRRITLSAMKSRVHRIRAKVRLSALAYLEHYSGDGP